MPTLPRVWDRDEPTSHGTMASPARINRYSATLADSRPCFDTVLARSWMRPRLPRHNSPSAVDTPKTTRDPTMVSPRNVVLYNHVVSIPSWNSAGGINRWSSANANVVSRPTARIRRASVGSSWNPAPAAPSNAPPTIRITAATGTDRPNVTIDSNVGDT